MGKYDSITNFAMSFSNEADNLSGIDEEAYFIPLLWMKSMGVPKQSSGAASLIEISEPHVMLSGKKPVMMTPLYKKSGFKFSSVGEESSLLFKQGPAEFFISEMSAENLGTLTAIKKVNTEFMQIGSKSLSATVVSVEGDKGMGPTGQVGFKVVFEAYGLCPYYIYKFDLPTDKAPAPPK